MMLPERAWRADERALTATQVAAMLQISSDTVYRLAARGELPGCKVGKQWRFSKASVQEWFEGQAHPGAHQDAGGGQE